MITKRAPCNTAPDDWSVNMVRSGRTIKNPHQVEGNTTMRLLALVIVSLVLSFSTGDAQDAVQIGRPMLCPECVITADSISTIGIEDTMPGALAEWPMSAVATARDEVVVPAVGQRGTLGVYGLVSGRFERSFGRWGEGPGEYQNPRTVGRGLGDTLLVYDSNLRRISVLDADYKFVRSYPAPAYVNSFITDPAGQVVMAGLVYTEDLVGYPLQIFRSSGAYVGTGGLREEFVTPRRREAHVWILGPGESGTIWGVVRAHRFEIRQWTRDGRRIRQWSPQIEEFPPYDDLAAVTPDDPPQTSAWGIWQDEHTGYVWVLLQVGDPEFRRGLGKKHTWEAEGEDGSRTSETYYDHDDRRRIFDGLVVVFDPQKERILTMHRFDQAFEVYLRPGLVAGAQESEEGAPLLGVYRLSLETP
jgi:hypothetical protein